jgi:Mg2+-importing ATPase
MARRGVIVKRLPAIHNLGAMDLLCIDKTGTLTGDVPELDFAVDADGHPAPAVLRLAWRNSYWCVEGPAGPVCSPLDEALLKHAAGAGLAGDGHVTAVHVAPFDPALRCATVVLRQSPARAAGLLRSELVITKGAPADVLGRCSQVQGAAGPRPLGQSERARLAELAGQYASGGARALAVASAERTTRPGRSEAGAESGLTFAGFVGFRDPPRPTAPKAVRQLAACGIGLKVITGDHPLLAARVCREAGISPGTVIDGGDIDRLADGALAGVAEAGTVFARVTPDQKARLIRALRTAGHTVGYLGDGVNDAAALREADVGICVESAAEAARESAEVILARPDLTALGDAVVQGRLAFGNIVKYLKITISANVGNVASMVAATVVLPFLPMLPLQVLVQNLCFDLSQLTIAFDRVEEPSLTRPRTFDQLDLARFALFFGLANTLADLATFIVLRHLGSGHGGPAAQASFRAGWFTENLLSQAITVLVLRSRTGPSSRRRPPWPVLAGLAGLTIIGLFLPLSPLAAALALHAPPAGFFPLLAAVLGGYFALLLVARAAYRKASTPWP